MYKKISLSKTKRSLIIFPLIVTIIIFSLCLFLVDGPLWGLICIILFFIVSFLFIFLFIFYYECRLKKKLNNKWIFFLGVVLLVILIFFRPYMTMMTHLKADNNIDDLKRLVDDIISGVENDEEKTVAILEWFNLSARNIFNNYFLKEDGIFLIPIGKIAIIFGEPYIGIRTYDNDDSLWILTSRYGHCGEYGLLFRDMANAAGLSVRMVVCPGEDHVWDEVLIDDTWIIIDPTRVGSAPDNGYNLMWNFMEIKAKGNISYVYADYLNSDVKEDITFRYTEKLTNITILAVDSDGSPLSDVTVSLKSNNRYLNHPAGLIKKTNASGKCHYNIGDGDYTFELSTDGIIPLVGSYSGIFKGDQSYVERVELHLDWVRVILIVFIVFICFIVGLIYFLRVRKKE